MLTRAIVLGAALVAAVLQLQAQSSEKSSPSQTEFMVLSSDAYTTTTARNCGSGGSDVGSFFKGLCDGLGPQRQNHHTAVVIDVSGTFGYLVECPSPRPVWVPCEPLTAGQRLSGYVKSGKLTLHIDGKTRTYSIVKSVYNRNAEKMGNGDIVNHL